MLQLVLLSIQLRTMLPAHAHACVGICVHPLCVSLASTSPSPPNNWSSQAELSGALQVLLHSIFGVLLGKEGTNVIRTEQMEVDSPSHNE